MRSIIRDRTFDAERSLYGLESADVFGCTFAGPADGESALKECRDIVVDDCTFSLRYPMWHDRKFVLRYSTMDGKTRAALWYSEDGKIEDCVLGGVKAVRECSNISISRCTIDSVEFGWKSRGLKLDDCEVSSEYIFLDSSDIRMKDVTMKGKYSFQYVDGLVIEHCNLDTKDAFWHSRNVVVRDSTVKGEYLGWYSENLTLENCRIVGTQPLCYCRNLKLVDCTMEGCDLAFEYSDVEADVKGRVDSVKNPLSGSITVDSVGEVIRQGAVHKCSAKVLLRDGTVL